MLDTDLDLLTREELIAECRRLREGIRAHRDKPVLNLGLPDRFIEQGTQDEIYALLGLDGAGILASIQAWQQA